MRRGIRIVILILSTCALLSLPLVTAFFLYSGAGEWATARSTQFRVGDEARHDDSDFRITPFFIRYRTRSMLTDADTVRRFSSQISLPAAGQIHTNARRGFRIPEHVWMLPPPARTSQWDILGIGKAERDWPNRHVPDAYNFTMQERTWYCSTFWPALLLLLLSIPIVRRIVMLFIRIRRAHRNRVSHLAGICPTCGYDIRATPERCPECGRFQYTPDKPTLRFTRRMTWLLGGVLIALPIATMILHSYWEQHQRYSPFRDNTVDPILHTLFILYWLAIFAWAIRHIIRDTRHLLRAYAE